MAKDPAALMAQYFDGDTSALGELYAMTAPQLLSYLRILLRDHALAEDVLQDTYLKMSAARNTYIRGADPMPWLDTIARRTAVDEMRRIFTPATSGGAVLSAAPRSTTTICSRGAIRGSRSST